MTYYEEHKEKIKAYNRTYYKLHKAEILQKRQNYRNANKTYINKYHKEYRMAHKTYFSEYMRFYRWYDLAYLEGAYYTKMQDYYTEYNAVHRSRKAQQALENKLAKNNEIGSREIEILAQIKDINTLLAYLSDLKRYYHI